ncbi:MAG: 7-carboxy-7-deazaguanine synthase QueE [Fibrobacteres bacterium]|nr:7-carboxy-7-deazaguanine synthase QueE [Fibrobacterota bacterium]
MNVARILYGSSSNSPVPDQDADVVWFSGCTIKCPECINRRFWEPRRGAKMSVDQVVQKVLMGRSAWVSLTGGEPSEQPELVEFLKLIRAKKRKVLINTGLEYEEFISLGLLEYVDALKYGPYMAELRGGFGSLNQRMIIRAGDVFAELPYRDMKELIISNSTITETGYGTNFQ